MDSEATAPLTFPTGRSVMGLDLSLAATGVALPDGRVGTIRTAPQPSPEDRLLEISTRITVLILEALPELVVIEAGFVGSRQSSVSFDLGMLHGVVRTWLRRKGLAFLMVPPGTLKVFATGNGGAAKPDMRMELFKRAGLDIKDDNQVDAWWLRAMGHQLYGEPLLALPADHIRALAKIKLPTA